MLRDSPEAGADALRRFIERFRQDASFHDLVRNDIHAALAEVGITVPRGVKVDFASDMAVALNMTLDSSPSSGNGASVLDDDELESVAGGVDACPRLEDIARFLRVFKYSQV